MNRRDFTKMMGGLLVAPAVVLLKVKPKATYKRSMRLRNPKGQHVDTIICDDVVTFPPTTAVRTKVFGTGILQRGLEYLAENGTWESL